MPTFRFQCPDCGLQYKRRMSAQRARNLQTCFGCEAANAYRILPESVGFTFSGSTDGSMSPQNTGVSSVDYNHDRIIGEASVEQWKLIARRNASKEEALQDSDACREDLRRELDGSYTVLKPEEKNARDFAMSIHNEAHKQGFGVGE